MLHKVSEMCDMIERMYDQSKILRHKKYNVPKLEQNETEINEMIASLQYMAQLVANDRSTYVRRDKDELNRTDQ